MSAAKVTQCPNRSDTPDQQRTARTTIGIVTSCSIIITNQFRKVFIRSSPVNDSKRGGKGNQRIAEFLTEQF
jgi:xanthine/uracil permease